MKYTFQVQPDDMVQLRRLGMRPRKWLAIVGYVVLAILAAAMVLWIYEWIASGVLPGGIGWTFGLAAYFWFIFAVAVPWRQRRIFRQQKTLRHPVTVEFTEEAFVAEAAHGHSRLPWAELHKWKSNSKLILIYHSDALCNLVPRRAFASDEDFQAARTFVARKMGPEQP